LAKRRRRLESVVATIDAIALEFPSARLARLLSGLASHLSTLERGLSYRIRYRRQLAWLRLRRALRIVLYHQYLAAFVAVVGIALVAPVLWRGWGLTDDTLQRTMLLSLTLPDVLAGQFGFLGPDRNAQLMDLGVLPWWTLASARVFFFRPLASLTHWLDYQLWPDSPFLMHAHNLLWYGGLCGLVTFAYRRFMGKGAVSGLAAILFAAGITHLSCVASLAGRNSLMALLFGVLTLLCHDRWQCQRRRAYFLLALFSLLLALLSAEAGLAIVAYLFSYAVCLGRGAWRQKLANLIPYGLLIAAWRFVYQCLGYGAWGSGFYIDPGRELLRFAINALENGPVLLLGQWIVLEPGMYALFSPGGSLVFWLVSVLVLILVGKLLLPLLRQDRVARFWALGMVLAVVPICAVNLPNGRLLTFVGLGAAGLMARFIVTVLGRSNALFERRAWQTSARTLAVILVGIHAVLSPLLLMISHGAFDSFFGSTTDLGVLPRAEQRDVIIVNVPSPGNMIYILGQRATYGESGPAHVRALAPGYDSVTVTRVDARTLAVRPEHGYLASSGLRGNPWRVFPLVHPAYGYRYGDGFFRSEAHPMPLGQRVELMGMVVEVTALTEGGRPAEARTQFALPLEDSSFIWLQWDWSKEAFVPFVPPRVGETVRISGPFQ
jgi:hypothetical protein